MATLTSKVFTDADQATVQKLEDCANGVPNEVVSHFTLRQSGEHIRRVQEALKSIQERNPDLGIPAFSVNGVYDQKFADAIRVYKTKRDIRNYANKIDDIVGMKTIRSLDQESKSGPPKVNPPPLIRPVKPGVFPRQLPNCVPDSDCPSSKQFDVTLLAGVTVGDGLEGGKFFFAIRDTTNGLSAGYVLLAIGGSVGALVTPVGGGKSSHFATGEPVRVTRFGPSASIGGFTPPGTPPGPFSPGASYLVLDYRPDGVWITRKTPPISIDTGPFNFGGAGADTSLSFTNMVSCSGQSGAVRRILGYIDFPT